MNKLRTFCVFTTFDYVHNMHISTVIIKPEQQVFEYYYQLIQWQHIICFLCAEGLDTDVQLALSQLFSSTVCEKLIAGAVKESCFARMIFIRDILITLCILQHIKVHLCISTNLVTVIHVILILFG